MMSPLYSTPDSELIRLRDAHDDLVREYQRYVASTFPGETIWTFERWQAEGRALARLAA